MLKPSLDTTTAFAPATCGNAIVGFDILGLAIAGIGDYVTLTRRTDNKLVIETIDSSDPIPTDPKKNVAAAVISNLCRDLGLESGFTLNIKKGIPLSSGLGGSAASAVAALTAFNHFLNQPLSLNELAHYALQGEALCSGQAHPDNIIPALYGGLTLITQVETIEVTALPIPNVICVLVHPQLQLLTHEARQTLAPNVALKTHSLQSAYLAGFISALYKNDLTLLQRSLKDVVIEPQRAHLIEGFAAVQHTALEHGALGASLSGAGPTMLALARNQHQATQIGSAMQAAFKQNGIASEIYLSPISVQGAHIIK